MVTTSDFINICKICVPITVVVEHIGRCRGRVGEAGCRLCCSLHPASCVSPYLLHVEYDVGRAMCAVGYIRCGHDHGVALCGLVSSTIPSATAHAQYRAKGYNHYGERHRHAPSA